MFLKEQGTIIIINLDTWLKILEIKAPAALPTV